MATLQQKIKAEQDLRDLVSGAGMPPPDEIEYGYTCIRAFWWDVKQVVIIDIDERPSEDDDPGAGWPDGSPLLNAGG
ncbi:MAG TPA: hypothetical protein VG223_13525 [Solirubrobacteraceae bacterium]|jgi:hypothetical protein|nr:hypothetical protein [Solirubrobacteraceae bacterium]